MKMWNEYSTLECIKICNRINRSEVFNTVIHFNREHIDISVFNKDESLYKNYHYNFSENNRDRFMSIIESLDDILNYKCI